MSRFHLSSRAVRPPVRFQGSFAARLQYSLHVLCAILLRGPRSGAIKFLASHLRPLFDERNAVVVDLGFPFRIDLQDPLWTRLLYTSYVYEPDIEFILTHALDCNTVFIDGGANKGYWSSFVLARPHKRVISVEAVERTFRSLEANVELSGGQADLIQAALFEVSGATLSLVADRQRPGRSHLLNPGVEQDPPEDPIGLHQHLETVLSLTLDDLLDRFLEPEDRRVIVKLDLEGAETSALKGGTRLLQATNPLVVYEDHGRDASAGTSRFVMEELGLAVFNCESGHVRRLVDHTEIQRAKGANRRLGTDFFACSEASPFFQTLADLTGESSATRPRPASSRPGRRS